MSSDQKGQGLVEYALIIMLVGVIVIATLLLLGRGVGNVYGDVNRAVQGQPIGVAATPLVSPGDVTPIPGGDATATPLPVPGDRPTSTPVTAGERGGGQTFFDSFDGSSAGDWPWQQMPPRNWITEAGKLLGGKQGGGEYRATAGNPSWTDYSVEAQAQLLQGSGYGVYFRATSPNNDLTKLNAYVFQYDPGLKSATTGGAFIFRKVVNGSETGAIQGKLTSVPTNYDWYSQPKTIRIDVSGSSFTAYVNGVAVLTASDSSFTQGAIGLRAWDSTVVAVDSVQVTPLTSPSSPSTT